jgi:hypothetical protein
MELGAHLRRLLAWCAWANRDFIHAVRQGFVR